MCGPIKVLATLGPSSIKEETVEAMARACASGFRVNMSHGDTHIWDVMVESVLKAESKVGRLLSLIADLEGPRVRLGSFEPIHVRRGDRVVIGENGVPIDSSTFFQVVEPGDKILVDDGRIILVAEQSSERKVVARALEGGMLVPRKGVAVAGKDFPLPALTKKDLQDLDYIAKKPFSHVMVSYARSPEHIFEVRRELKKRGADHIRVIAKIETPGAVKQAYEIAGASDGVVVARGDLGMHYPLEELPVVQHRIIEASRKAYRPVIVATELLPSMMTSPVPTRSDVMDVFTASRSGVDGLLLTSETAIGRYPVEAVSWLSRIAASAVRDYQPWIPQAEGREYGLARGIVDLSNSLNATLIVYSLTGTFPHRLSAFRPRKPYYVGLPTLEAARAVAILWGTIPLHVPAEGYEEGITKTTEALKEKVRRPIVQAAWSRLHGHYRIDILLPADQEESLGSLLGS